MLVRIWREILAGTVAMQTDFAVAVYAPDTMQGYWDLARDHYGSHTRMTALGTPSQVLRAVTEATASVGVLPMPAEGDPEPWWPYLISADPQTPRVWPRSRANPGLPRIFWNSMARSMRAIRAWVRRWRRSAAQSKVHIGSGYMRGL
jgi:hypothetical protein